MYIRERSYWLARCHPFELLSASERVIRWLTFGLYKPWLVSTVCGLLEEWKEWKDARDYEGTCG
jgi:hypothetical protein